MERFYTVSKNDPELVDQIEIDVENRCYCLLLDEREEITDGYNEQGEEIASWPVSRLVFDCIVKGIVDEFRS